MYDMGLIKSCFHQVLFQKTAKLLHYIRKSGKLLRFFFPCYVSSHSVLSGIAVKMSAPWVVFQIPGYSERDMPEYLYPGRRILSYNGRDDYQFSQNRHPYRNGDDILCLSDGHMHRR
jgi:hypothetical protein